MIRVSLDGQAVLTKSQATGRPGQALSTRHPLSISGKKLMSTCSSPLLQAPTAGRA
jgi:hypothetical protein